MNLNYEAIFDIYTFKGRKYLCHIKVNPKSKKFKNTCRSLSQEQWTTFDKKLEKLITANDELDEKGIKFKLHPYIVAKVQKSKLRVKHLSKLLEKIDESNGKNTLDLREQDFVLECLIDFQQEVSASAITIPEKQKYNPKLNISSNANVCSSLSYEPYIPSVKIYNEPKIGIVKNKDIEQNEDTYSPKPIVGTCLSDPHLPADIPQYTPAPINHRRKSKEIKKSNIIATSDNVKNVSAKRKVSSNKKHKRIECEYIPESQDVAILNVPIYIPTPIETTQDNVRKMRKRSNTIDVFTNLADENYDPGQSIIIKQTSYRDSLKHPSNIISLKKRSMTIDEVPTELSGMPVYIPTQLDKNLFQNVFKTAESTKGKELPSLKEVEFNQNQFCEEDVYHVVGSQSPKSAEQYLTNNLNQIIADKFGTVNSSISHEIPQHGNFNTFEKSDYSKQSLTETDESFQIKYDKNNMKTNSAESKTNENSLTKGLSELTEKNKNVGNRILHNSLFTSDQRDQKFLRIKKIENNGTKAVQNCRRSERSPNISKFLKKEQQNSVNKISRKHKPSLKNKDLFGTDDEDDDELHFANNNVNMISKSSESSTQKGNSLSKKMRHKSIEIDEK